MGEEVVFVECFAESKKGEVALSIEINEDGFVAFFGKFSGTVVGKGGFSYPTFVVAED